MKKLIALLLALVMVLCVFAGCTKAPVDEPVVEEPAVSEEPAAEPSEEPVEEPAEEGISTVILKEEDDSMINTYTLLAVDPAAPFADADGNPVEGVAINTAGADALIQWILSEGKALAGEYGMAEYGDSLFYVKADGASFEGEIAPAAEETKVIRLSTTTSVNDSGLLAAILPVFEENYGYTVEVQSAGTGKAIAAAQYGNADLILVHAKAKEQDFADAGFARLVEGCGEDVRMSFLYNFFVLCGPKDDPAGAAACENVLDSFAAIANGKHIFISRGDGSGTHTKELALWPEDLGITEDAASFADYTEWYTSANTGMGACLVMAEEMGGYILTDKATFLTFEANGGIMD